MNLIFRIISDLKDFVDFFYIKYKYDQRGILKRYRLKSGLNKQLNEEVWCDLFIYKAAYHYCAKFLLIKIWEDNGKIACKLNEKGIGKWNSLVTNIRESYARLYEVTEADILASDDMKMVFRQTDYDIFKVDDELAGFIIEKLRNYDFKEFDYQFILQIFNSLYTDNKQLPINLQYFYKPSDPIDFILSMATKKENLM